MNPLPNSLENALGHRTNELARQRLRFYRGCAVIDLNNLIFEESYESLGLRQHNQSNVDRLVKIFTIEGCGNLEPEHRVAAVIDQNSLTNALSISGVTQEQLLDPTSYVNLAVERDIRLVCVYGKHRLRAAEAFGIDCWLIDIYLDVLPDEARTQLREESSKCLDFTDGEIYRNFRMYKIAQNQAQAKKWWAKLRSDGRRKDFRRLQDNEPVREAFDQLLPYLGLWRPLKSSQIERMLGLKCPEMICRYLADIYQKWQTLFDSTMSNLVDTPSVDLIEGMFPQISIDDRERITELVETNQIFPLVRDSEDRTRLKHRLLGLEGRVTSLQTLIQDTLYLEGPAKALHRLCPPRFKGSLSDKMRRQWSAGGNRRHLEIQLSEHTFKYIPGASNSFTISMIQLLLFSFRHFVYNRQNTYFFEELEETYPTFTLHSLATVASRLGFSSVQIKALHSKPQSRTLARGIVETICRDEFLRLEEATIRTISSRFGGILTLLRGKRELPNGEALFTTDDQEHRAKRRFNKPTRSQYDEQRHNLFLEKIMSHDQPVALFPTSLGITRDILICFLGSEVISLVNNSSALRSASIEDENLAEGPNLPVAIGEHNNEPSVEVSITKENEAHCDAATPESPSETFSRSPVSLPPHPSGTPDDMTWETQPPLAPGFEDLLNIGPLETKIYMAHHRKIAEILSTWCSSNKHDLIVVFLFEDRAFYKYRAKDTFALRSSLTSLARDFCLMEVYEDHELRVPDLNKIVDAALTTRLIVGANKDNPSHNKPRGAEMSLDEFRNYLYTYDINTGKRNAHNIEERVVKRLGRIEPGPT